MQFIYEYYPDWENDALDCLSWCRNEAFKIQKAEDNNHNNNQRSSGTRDTNTAY